MLLYYWWLSPFLLNDGMMAGSDILTALLTVSLSQSWPQAALFIPIITTLIGQGALQ